jgi:hypothetical protein
MVVSPRSRPVAVGPVRRTRTADSGRGRTDSPNTGSRNRRHTIGHLIVGARRTRRSSQIRTGLLAADESCVHAATQQRQPGASTRRNIISLPTFPVHRLASRHPAPGSAYPVCARRGEYNSPTPTRSPRLSQVLSSNRSVASPASLLTGRSWPTSKPKHDAPNNSDVVSNNNREISHVKVHLDFKVCVSRHF